MRVIYFDECGYTGENLADRDAPMFVVASHDLAEEEAALWKRRFFQKIRADELKHSKLQRRTVHHDAVVDFLGAALTQGHMCATLAHKTFALVAKLIDWLVEPVLYEAGINLYERRANVALATVVYASLTAHGEIKSVVQSFQRAARTRRGEHAIACNNVLLSPRVQEALGEIGEYFSISIARRGLNWAAEMPPNSLDLSVTLALGACYLWRRRGFTSFEIVHDRSSAMARERDVWKAILSKDAPTATIGHEDFQVQFPIGVESTRFEDSRTLVGLQLADVIAGAVGRWATWLSKGQPADDRYAARLGVVIEAHGERSIDLSVWPAPSVEPGARAPAGVVDPLEYLTCLLGTMAND